MPNIKVNNMSNGLFDSADKTQMPRASWPALSNWDIMNSTIETRDGATAYNTSPIQPGCLRFGYAEDQRVHYLKATGGDYGFTVGTDTSWNVSVYCKELSATTCTDERTIIAFANGSGTLINRLYFDGATLKFQYKEDTSQSFHTMTCTTAQTRHGRTDYLITLSLDIAASTITARAYLGETAVGSSSFAIPSGYESGGASTWTAYSMLIVGCDANLVYPGTNYTNGSNQAIHGYIGELCLTKNETISTVTDIKNSYNVIPPGNYCAATNRIAYYPLRSNLDDAWGSAPSFNEDGVFVTGGGLSAYSIENEVVNSASTFDKPQNILYCTHSWHVNTYGKDQSQAGKTSGLTGTYQEYVSSVTDNEFTLTFDLLPVRMGSSSADYTIFESATLGPKIYLSYKSANEVLLSFKMTKAASNVTTTEVLRCGDVHKINCQYDTTNTDCYVRIFKELTEANSNTMAIGTGGRGGEWSIGTYSVSDVNIELYISGLVLHNAAIADEWGDIPGEDIENVTTWEVKPKKKKDLELYQKLFGIEGVGEGNKKIDKAFGMQVTKAQRTGEESWTFARFDKLYNYETNVKGLWLFNEISGYDTATTLTPNGRILNLIGSEGDGSDFNLYYMNQPTWIPDRNSVGLTTAGFQSTFYEKDIDNAYGYLPNNPNITDKLILNKNGNLYDKDNNTISFSTTYKYGRKKSGSLRGFNYGNSLYLHNEEMYRMYNGNDLMPVQIPQPTAPLTATKGGSSGLRGAYMYTYTFVGYNGLESYPAIPTAVTVSGGTITLRLDPRIDKQSYLYDVVMQVNIYRNRGTTLSTTDLTTDAGITFYRLKTIDVKTVVDTVGSDLYVDDVSDYYIQETPPYPGDADPIPPCKYSVLHNDYAYFTGNSKTPHTYYQSQHQQPALLNTVTPYDEFRAEKGEVNTAIGATGSGIIVFKKNSRKYIADDGRKKEFHDGGCVAHDTLQQVNGGVIGLGNRGFFWTNGYAYKNLNRSIHNKSLVSTIQRAVDGWSAATKEAAYAVYHAPTHRYICYVDNKFYIYNTDREVWAGTYEGFVGLPVVYDDNFYVYKYGYLWQEVATQSYVGGAAYASDVRSGTTGEVIIASTDSVPTTPEGLPIYIDATAAWVTAISDTSTGYIIRTDSNTNFASASKVRMGIIKAKAEKFYNFGTPNKRTLLRQFLMEHDNTTDGEIVLRFTKNQGSFTETFDDYIADTDLKKIQYCPHIAGVNVGFQLECRDGKKHVIRNYTAEYEQGIY